MTFRRNYDLETPTAVDRVTNIFAPLKFSETFVEQCVYSYNFCV
jgi:hypothetical protein